MLKLKPLGEPQGRSLVHTSQHLLSLRIQVCHPHTRTHVRLLGPCFKTGRLKPFRQRLQPRSRGDTRTHIPWLPKSPEKGTRIPAQRYRSRAPDHSQGFSHQPLPKQTIRRSYPPSCSHTDKNPLEYSATPASEKSALVALETTAFHLATALR
jgi:hypothetical protein